MSDDVITGFLQSQPVTNGGVKVESEQGNGSQDADFKSIFSHEEKKLFNGTGAEADKDIGRRDGSLENEKSKEAIRGLKEQQEPDLAGSDLPDLAVHNAALSVGRIVYTSNEEKKLFNGTGVEADKDIGHRDGSLESEKSKEAIRGLKEQQEPDLAGSDLPDLAVHNGALAVGRIIYTAKNIAVTTESLSKFMIRQGLVSESLKQVPIKPSDGALGQEIHDEASGLDPAKLKTRDPEVDSGLKLTSLPAKPPVKKESVIDNSLSLNFQREVGLELETSKKEKINQDRIELELRIKQRGDMIAQTVKPGHLGGGLDETREVPNYNAKSLSLLPDGAQTKEQREVNAEPVRDGLVKDVVFKNKEQALENPTKNQDFQGVEGRIVETKKGQAHGQLHLQRFLGEIKETVKVAQEIDNAKPVGSTGYSDPVVKGLRDSVHHASQETVAQDLSQSRVEFKGALKEAQRAVSTSVYNSLTDSYERWNSRFSEVLANRIAGHLSKENWNVHLKMNPASLGEISLEIDFSEKGLEGRLGANEESTRQLLQDTLPKLRLALREILEENQGLKLDVGEFGKSNSQDRSERAPAPSITEELDFESEVLAGNTLDPKLDAVVGLNILV